MIVILNEENVCIGPAFVAGEDRALQLPGSEDGQGEGVVGKDLEALGRAGEEL